MRRHVRIRRNLQIVLAAILGLGLSVGWKTAPARASDRVLPAVVDLTGQQSPIRSQGGRGTCIFHPGVAALEAAYRRVGINVNLSVENLIWNARTITLLDHVGDVDVNENHLANLGGGCMSAWMGVLTRYGICSAEDMPYRPDYDNPDAPYFRGFDVSDFRWFEPFRQISLNRFNLDPHQFPQAARQNARYGIKSYVVLSERDRHDPRKIEEILASGHEVGVGVAVSFKKGTAAEGRGDIPPVVWYRAKDAVAEGEGHAVLLVGYDHTRQFFIVKNSWGPNNSNGYDPAKLPNGWKDIAKFRGFTLIHYNYLIDCGDAAYITGVVNPNSNRFRRQRVMGLWNVEFKQKSTGRKVASTVLAWRRLPGTDPKIINDMRIGDFYWHGGQYRVNAQLTGTDPLAAYLYIDFRHPQTPYDQARGVRFYGVASVADNQPATMQITQVVANGNVEKLFGVPLSDLVGSAEQAVDDNPLIQIPTPNLLVNGSFEDGPTGKKVLPQDVGSTAIKGWTVTRGQIDYLDSYWRADEGKHSLDLHGSPGYGGVAQTIKTKKGRRYRVTFSLAGTPRTKPAVKRVAVSAAGKQQEFSFDATGKTAKDMGWSTKTWEFTATDPTTTLEIYTLENTDPYCGPALDDVRVVPVVR